MVCFVCQKQATMSRIQKRSRQTPPFYECEHVLPPPQEGTPKFVIGDLDHDFMQVTIGRQLRRYTQSGMQEFLQDLTLEQHGVVVDTMKQMKAAVSGYNVLLVKTARNTKDEPSYRKITKLQFAYQRLNNEFNNAINRMKSAGTRHFMPKQVPGDAMEENADDIQENEYEIAGMGAGAHVIGIEGEIPFKEIQPPPPLIPHPLDAQKKPKREYEPNYGDSKEESDYAASLNDRDMYAYLGQKLGLQNEADLVESQGQVSAAEAAVVEWQGKVSAAEAAVVESKGQVSAAETAVVEWQGKVSAAEAALVESKGQVSAAETALVQSQGQVSAAEVALVESHRKSEEAKRLVLVAKNSLQYQEVLMKQK